MLSVGSICFEDRLCVSRKGRTGGCQCMAAVAAATEMVCSALDGLFFCFLAEMSLETSPFTFRDLISGFLGSFQLGGASSSQRTFLLNIL